MKSKGLSLLIIVILLSPLIEGASAAAQAVRAIPTRIDSANTPADITIKSGVSQVVGTGDFNGDRFGDILVGNNGVAYVFFGGPLRAPKISKAKYRKGSSELIITGTDLTGAARLEVNGVVVDREVTFEPAEGRLVLRGEKSELNLRKGKNHVVVIRKSVRSNRVKLRL